MNPCNCRFCQQPLRIEQQSGYWLETCDTPDCATAGFTLDAGTRERMTPEEVTAHTTVHARFAARRAAFEAVSP